ncbi:DNA ligase [Nocardioides sp.]|uniref:ATP-dependent DNA ligase n=1 Tax=Nocardioides sp. TaxID=35761 RepID=UPI001A2EA6B1|nr:DNA ligase [Nocardioides sp.]MBJ7359909.1 DNA ligase [Nocardioides sp.]
MLATKGTHVPVDPGWSHEVKWDGVRVLADTTAGGTRLLSRNENPVTVAWPELNRSPLGDRDLLVDGEVIALNERGLPDFRVLQDRMHVRNAASAARLAERLPATYMVFDVMRLDGRDLTSMPLGERRKILGDLGLEHSTWQVPDAYDDGPMLFEATLQQGLEGIVSKRLTSRYVFGERTRNWLKFAHRHRRSNVVGGWRPQEGTTDRLAALLVGEMTPEGLVYRGRVGSGIGATASRALTPLVAPLGRSDSPFADEVPRVDAAGSFWLEPRLVVDVETHGVGYTRLRQPSYCGVRPDLTPDLLMEQS